MKRLAFVTVLSACLFGTVQPIAQATEASALFQAVPADAWGLIAVRSLAELDTKLMSLGQATNNPMAGMSPLMMAKGMLGLFTGVEDNGGAAAVLMPAESYEDMGKHLAVFIPTNNYEALLGLMQPEDLGGGVSKVLFQQKECYVARKGDFAILCPNAEALQAVLTGQGSVTANMTEHQLARLEKDDIVAWANLAAITASPMFAGVTASLEGQGIGAELLTAMKSAQVSVHLSPDGIDVGVYLDAKPGTPMAKLTAGLKPPAHPLLAGLPAESYVLAAGKVASGGPELGEMAAESMDKAVGQVARTAPAYQAMAANVVEVAKKMVGQIRTTAFALNTLPEGTNGLAAATWVLGVEGGSAAFLDSVGATVQAIKSSAPEEKAAALASLSYTPKAGGTNMDHLTIDLAAFGLGEQESAIAAKILGPEGLLFRLCAVDEKHVAVTLGGGAAHLETVAKLTKGAQAPLAQEAGIKQVAEAMPDARVGEMFISPNGAMDLISVIAKTGGVAEFPFKLPPVKTPIAACGRCTPGGGMQFDLLIPMELIKAAGQAAMPGMGPGPGGLGGPGEPGQPPM